MQNQRNNKIIEFLLKNLTGGSSLIFDYLSSEGIETSLITVKRDLAKLTLSGVLEKHEKGPETSYSLSIQGRLFAPIDAHLYCSIEPDKRYGASSYNFSLFENLDFQIFSETELKNLSNATKNLLSKKGNVSEVLNKKEFERFVIELSWKSSKMEGNTYSLLQTEKLVREGIEAVGHSKQEANMILNHKKAFGFVYDNKELFKKIDRTNIEKIHSLLADELDIKKGYRSGLVGITGSKYRPLDNIHQIHEAMEKIISAVNKIENAYSKALIALLGLSYTQPFEDGNKRTSRMLANAILMAYDLSPLSYRSVSEDSYREAVLVFYELNSLNPFKKIFIEQYVFATENYFMK